MVTAASMITTMIQTLCVSALLVLARTHGAHSEGTASGLTAVSLSGATIGLLSRSGKESIASLGGAKVGTYQINHHQQPVTMAPAHTFGKATHVDPPKRPINDYVPSPRTLFQENHHDPRAWPHRPLPIEPRRSSQNLPDPGFLFQNHPDPTDLPPGPPSEN